MLESRPRKPLCQSDLRADFQLSAAEIEANRARVKKVYHIIREYRRWSDGPTNGRTLPNLELYVYGIKNERNRF